LWTPNKDHNVFSVAYAKNFYLPKLSDFAPFQINKVNKDIEFRHDFCIGNEPLIKFGWIDHKSVCDAIYAGQYADA
jgi:hypothetical protein